MGDTFHKAASNILYSSQLCCQFLQRLALGLDWLNIDFQRNIRHMVERAVSTIQEKLEGLEGPWPWSFSLASLVSRSPEVLQCR